MGISLWSFAFVCERALSTWCPADVVVVGKHARFDIRKTPIRRRPRCAQARFVHWTVLGLPVALSPIQTTTAMRRQRCLHELPRGRRPPPKEGPQPPLPPTPRPKSNQFQALKTSTPAAKPRRVESTPSSFSAACRLSTPSTRMLSSPRL